MRHKFLDRLTPADRAKLIALAESDDPPTLNAIAARFNISRGWACDIVKQARVVASSSQGAVGA